MAEPFATVEDLQARWRPLSDQERRRAEVLIGDVTDLIMATCPRWDKATDLTRRRITCAVVKRAMQGDSGMGGSNLGAYPEPRGTLSAESHTTGPYTDNYTYSNPDGDLFLKAKEIQALGGARSRAHEVDLLHGARPMSQVDELAWLFGGVVP